MLFEHLPAARPGKAGRGPPLYRRVGQEEIFRARLASRELVDDGVRRRGFVPSAKLMGARVPRKVMAFLKEVNEKEGIERMTCLFRPIIAAENNVAIKPGYLVAVLGHAL